MENIDNQTSLRQDINLFDIEALLKLNIDVDEIVVHPQHIEEDIQKTIDYMNEALENQNTNYYDDPLHMKEFFENIIRLFYLRNELSPYLVCLTDKEYKELFKQGQYFCTTSEAFKKFLEEHYPNRDFDDEHDIFIKKQVKLNRISNEDEKQLPHLLKAIVFAHFSHDTKMEGKMTFQDYLDKIGLKSIAYLQELFDEMVTYKPHLEMKYYSLTKVKDAGGSSGNHIFKKDLEFFDAVKPYITNCPDYTSKRATDRSAKYLVFQPYNHLSAKQVYQYFYQIYRWIFILLYVKIDLQMRYKQAFQNIDLPENMVEEMANGFGYDLYLIYASRHWKNESKKIVEKFNHSLSGYIYASIVNRVNFSSTKESHDCQENGDFQKDEDGIYRSVNKKPHEHTQEELSMTQMDTDIQVHTEKTNYNGTDYTSSQGMHNDVKEFCNCKGIYSDYAIALTREWTSFRKKHSSLKDYRQLDQIELTEKKMQNFENHYLRTFSYMNISILKKQNVKYAQALISFLDFYVFTLMRDFYEELNDFHYKYLHVQDQKQKEKEIIRILKGQLWHMGYLFYRIDIVMIGETSQKMNQNESEGQIFKKGFENYIRQNKKLNKDEMIRKILTDTFHLLKYYYIPALESPYLDYVFDEQQKSQIKDYVNLLEYYWAEFSEHKAIYKVAFGHSNAPNNIKYFLYHTYHPENVYKDMLMSNQWIELIQNIEREVAE